MSDFEDRPSSSGNSRNLFERFAIPNHDDTLDASDLDIGDDESDVDFGEMSDDASMESASDSGSDTASVARPTGPAMDGQASRWVPVQPPEPESDAPTVPRFTVRNVGPRGAPPRNSDPIMYFELFFNRDMITHIVRETNKYARLFLEDENVAEWMRDHPQSRFKRWPEGGIDSVRMRKYLGLLINMGLIRKKKMADYWTTRPSQRTPFFNDVMPFWLFSLINRMLHVSDRQTEVPRGEEGFDPWHKVRPVLDRLNTSFKQYYVPDMHISIDESMIGMKNRVAYIQYLPNKRHARFGIKKFELCDDNGYVQHIELYAGKDFHIRYPEGQAHGVVIELMTRGDLLNKGYHLFTDNFYTKPKLAEALYKKKTFLTGTVRRNTKDLPREVANAKLKPGETKYLRKDEILTVAFREKKSQTKPVVLLSTFHNAEDVTTEKRGKEVTKPSMVLSYNQHMGGVDISDKMIYHLSAERATHRYWVKIFRNLLDISLLNAFVLYDQNTDKIHKVSRHDFYVSIVEALCSAAPVGQGATAPSDGKAHVAEHKLILLPGRKEMDCEVCSNRKGGKRRRSRRWCPACGVGCHEKCEDNLEHYKRAPRRGTKRKAQDGQSDSE